jgi:hypothetical protein
MRKPKMKLTIKQKAESAVDALDWAAVTMHRQMKSNELDQAKADKEIFSAQRKVGTFKNAYFARTLNITHLPQLREFHHSDLLTKIEIAYERFGRVLKHYAKAVGADFIEGKTEIEQ